MAKKVLSLFLALSLALTLIACGKQEDTSNVDSDIDGTASEDTIVLQFSDCHSPTATNHLAMQKIAEEVKAQTNGRIEIEIYPSSQLGDVQASMEAMQMGTLDMGVCNMAVIGSIVPEFGVLGAPFMFETDDQVANALNGELGEKLGDLVKEHGISVACYLPTGFRHVFSSKDIQSIDDFAGVKIRVMENPIDIALFKSLGAIPTPMAYSEVFTAMQQNAVDGAENALSNIVSDGFMEVVKSVTLSGHTYNVCPILISNTAIEKIPEDLRDTFFQACRDGAEKGRQLCMADNESAIAKLEEAGIAVYDIDREALKEATASIYTEYADRIPADLVELVNAAER